MIGSDLLHLERAERTVLDRKVKKVIKDVDALKSWLFGGSGGLLPNIIEEKVEFVHAELIRSNSINKEKYQSKFGLKVCTCCGETLELSKFYTNPRLTDGYFSNCKKCFDKIRKDIYNEKIHTYNEIKNSDTKLLCKCCNQLKHNSEFAKQLTTSTGFSKTCKECKKGKK